MPITWTISCFWDGSYLVTLDEQEQTANPMTVSQALDLVLKAAMRRLRSHPDMRDMLFDEIKPIQHALTALAPLQALHDSEINFEVEWTIERRFA
jgi:hypothetical protein